MSKTIREVKEALKTENNFVFNKLYENNFYKISKFVQNNNGNEADAEDLFQDTMVILIDKIRQEQFQLTASIDTYMYAISKNLWLKKLRKRNTLLSIDNHQVINFQNSISNSNPIEKTYLEKLKGYLLKITDHCFGLLKDFFFNELAIEKIQKKYGYTTIHNTQNQKYKCIKQIRKLKELEERSKKK